ncbi:SDR family NAD(P)-dependent oxidoreductase [Candidatus Lokiarchaeum ossiferum]|uniref:SDR family NAD(P)-dependent oxidoreductase n=1 Tax=Candidatus Lokiarchaeum ossiferum TaxID=2951803 RepID=UPI00352FD51A
MKLLVTGGAGFIGFHLCNKLLKRGDTVVCVDNINPYYDVELKKRRINLLKKYENFRFYKVDISDYKSMKEIFKNANFNTVVNLAAQAGVRHSISHPFEYEKSNNLGFLTILELIKKYDIKNLVYASSSSVYGGNREIPFVETALLNSPISLYAATKQTNELYAHVYHHLFNINTIGLRFFTVYGSWGRPDMATMLFTKSILNNDEIKVFNNGDMLRDFTHVSDIVDGIIKSIKFQKGYEIFNLGNNNPISLTDFISTLEKIIGKKSKKVNYPLQPGDLKITYANIDKAKKFLQFDPKTSLDDGLKEFYEWYSDYYNINH